MSRIITITSDWGNTDFYAVGTNSDLKKQIIFCCLS